MRDDYRDTLPDIPGVRNRWRRWYSFYFQGARMTVEELYGDAYLVPGPPLVRISYEE